MPCMFGHASIVLAAYAAALASPGEGPRGSRGEKVGGATLEQPSTRLRLAPKSRLFVSWWAVRDSNPGPMD